MAEPFHRVAVRRIGECLQREIAKKKQEAAQLFSPEPGVISFSARVRGSVDAFAREASREGRGDVAQSLNEAAWPPQAPNLVLNEETFAGVTFRGLTAKFEEDHLDGAQTFCSVMEDTLKAALMTHVVQVADGGIAKDAAQVRRSMTFFNSLGFEARGDPGGNAPQEVTFASHDALWLWLREVCDAVQPLVISADGCVQIKAVQTGRKDLQIAFGIVLIVAGGLAILVCLFELIALGIILLNAHRHLAVLTGDTLWTRGTPSRISSWLTSARVALF